jgi:hypothetical protein
LSALNGISVTAGNNVQFTVAGVPGFNYTVQASTNLTDGVPLITNCSPFNFTDTNIAGLQQRYYRTFYAP